ncbi:uncharacterized protein LOC131322890 [Rhododendron vialii]|uniref:uncharacterized protein LOC131322890 n=1 Tax=Rhododendron vialii TaxID=182163 RepID=UPI00265E98BA|nr:uncharacterized protein LOC131322890 [Rhododendron vialii]
MAESRNASSAASSAANCDALMKKKSTDVAWDYAVIVDASNKERLRCILCGNVYNGGINRMKKHIAQIKGEVASCTKASKEDQLKCKQALDYIAAKKLEKKKQVMNLREEVNVIHESNGFEDNEVGNVGSKKRPYDLGPMDSYTEINPDGSNTSGFKKTRQQNLNDAIWKERSHQVNQYLARWVYEAGIPFHAVDNDSFKRFVEAVGQFGPGYRPPSQYQLREPLLKEEVERTKTLLKKQEAEWASTGCSIMTDAWTDRKRRSIMNLCVNCKQGTCFLSSKEDSEVSHTGVYIFDYIDKFIEDIGVQNVVQVVTDNASNNMAAADLLKIKRPNIFWTSCATHTINLMLEGIGKQSKFKGIIEKAKTFTIYVYAHHNTLAMMRKYTKKRDIMRPGVTRFATAFLTLQSLMKKKQDLRTMFSSDAWGNSKWAKSAKGKAAYATVMSMAFWNGVSLCLKVFAPLVMVLRLVDGDRKPAMGFVYGELKKAKEEIKEAYKQVETNYRPILDVIDVKAKGRLDSALHLTAYFLNPFYFFKDSTIQDDPIIMDGVLVCVEAFFPDDINVQDEVINRELLKYKNKDGGFGRPLAARGCGTNDDSYDPVGWWSNYGNHTSNLKRMATRILSLTSSSSGCERNWSTFEGIHTKKRNRLDATRLNNLVYVQFNAKLINNKRKGKDVLRSCEATNAQGWIVEGGDEEVDPVSGLTWEVIGEATGADEVLQPRRSARNVGVRELDEEDFVSEDETKEEVDEDFEFESDGDQVMEAYGEEEEE